MNDQMISDESGKIKLLRLSLNSFKGVRQFTLEPQGRNVLVRGDNATGKTTLADAFSWLLFGKDSEGRAEFEIKTLGPDGEAIHGLEHMVKAAVTTNHVQTRLCKVYREKWTKRRGSADKEFTGHTKDHFVNDVPVTQAEYERHVAALGSERIFRLLTNPREFAERLHWQERRRVLLDVCGDISAADVIASSQDLADLTAILEGRSRTIDDHRKVAQARQRKINEELDRIPVRIDEVSLGLPDVEADEGELRARLEEARYRRGETEAERSRIQSGGQIAELTKRLREIEGNWIEEFNRQSTIADKSVRALKSASSEIEAEIGAIDKAIFRHESGIQRDEAELHSLEGLMGLERERWHELDELKFSPAEGADICAACGQCLPEERVYEALRKAEAEFNLSKAGRLEEITKEGKRIRKRHDETKADFEEHRTVIGQNEKDRDCLTQELEHVKIQIAGREEKPSEKSAKESELLIARATVEAEIAALRKGNEAALCVVSDKLEALNTEIVETETKLNRTSQRCAGEQRIVQLKGDERRLAGEFEELERQLYLCDEFTRRKVSMLTDQINSRFALARFKLFNVLVNGAIEECCEITQDGVPWSSLNTGAQVNIGLDVIRTLSKHHGCAPPIFIDHAESVTELIDTPGQQIRLVVSEGQDLLMEEVR